MQYASLQKLSDRLFFTSDDVAQALSIKKESARVLCTRYVKQGIFIRLKKNFYVLDLRWKNPAFSDMLKTANFLQVPSYISFMTALSFYEITTQAQRNFVESASSKRSVRFEARGIAFNYYKLQKQYYFDFVKKNDIFIATPEKAFMDVLYLYSLGKYRADFASLDMEKLDRKKLSEISAGYPQKTKTILDKLCRI